VLACVMAIVTTPYAERKFVGLLHEQVRHEFTAHQQYLAVAVWFDARGLPQLAKHFYAQALEERRHALMMVKYLLDRDVPVQIPGVDPVRNDFSAPLELIELALEQERTVTAQVEQLFTVAREEGDAIGEQFILWFLKEQVEEVAAMSTLVTVAHRAGDQLFQIEDFLARETVGDGGTDPLAPTVAGEAR
jgi:bacterioferritin B